MHSKLQQIINYKHQEVITLKNQLEINPAHPIHAIISNKQKFGKSLQQQCQKPGLQVIAEIKRHSPSKGFLASISDPIKLAEEYLEGDAAALSILTDEPSFHGHINDLQDVANSFKNKPSPILRKDFLVDPLQIAQAKAAGADAVLLIVAVLQEKTKLMLDYCHHCGVEALVEIHDKQELNIAIDAGATLIGVNNRNLSTFDVDVTHCLKLINDFPSNITAVAESGIHDIEMAKLIYGAGFDSVLVGEALVRSKQPKLFIQQCRALQYVKSIHH